MLLSYMVAWMCGTLTWDTLIKQDWHQVGWTRFRQPSLQLIDMPQDAQGKLCRSSVCLCVNVVFLSLSLADLMGW